MSNTERLFDHISLTSRTTQIKYQATGRASKASVIGRDPKGHAENLKRQFFTAIREAKCAAELIEPHLRAEGINITVNSEPGYVLKLEGLDNKRGWWTLLSAKELKEPDATKSQTVGKFTTAAVWVPSKTLDKFESKLGEFGEVTESGKPRNAELLANIAEINKTRLEDLWQSQKLPPQSGRHWFEVWLRSSGDAYGLLDEYCRNFGIRLNSTAIRFEDRVVALVNSSWQELDQIVHTQVPIAEIRPVQTISSLHDLAVEEQSEYAQDLQSRLIPAPDEGSVPTVCLLDMGVFNKHILLEGSLSEKDKHSVFPNPKPLRHSHGTKMAGIALFGNLEEELLGAHKVQLAHRLESVELLRQFEPHSEKLYGSVTAQAVALPEIEKPTRKRVFHLAVTADQEPELGPSSWSASVDALAVGGTVSHQDSGIQVLDRPDFDMARLFVISAGNVDQIPAKAPYLDACDASKIQDPAQAWNALVVGAHTDLVEYHSAANDRNFELLAEKGDLSPHSRTGFKKKESSSSDSWPIRPDICMEGGNALSDGESLVESNHSELVLTTTDKEHNAALDTACATSAATAQAARLAARLWARYPEYWPETIRGLLPHSAQWTPRMKEKFEAVSGKAEKADLLRRYGWGVPTQSAVENSSFSAVTMIVQDQFVAFEGPDFKSATARLHELPWPVAALQELAEADVTLRVTLSYFVEPNASRRGWANRYRYQSHGLRFELARPNESRENLLKRLRKSGSDQPEEAKWLIGPTQRRGSLRQDVWEGYGAELASTGGYLAVYPVGGWWKYKRVKQRQDMLLRYSLIVSLKTAEQTVDLYTPIVNAINLETAVVT